MLIVLLSSTGRLLCLDSCILLPIFLTDLKDLITSNYVCKLPLVELWKLLSNCLAVCVYTLFSSPEPKAQDELL